MRAARTLAKVYKPIQGHSGDLKLGFLYRYVVQTYVRPEVVFTHAEGVRMYDAEDKEYLDFAAGIAVNALGTVLG